MALCLVCRSWAYTPLFSLLGSVRLVAHAIPKDVVHRVHRRSVPRFAVHFLACCMHGAHLVPSAIFATWDIFGAFKAELRHVTGSNEFRDPTDPDSVRLLLCSRHSARFFPFIPVHCRSGVEPKQWRPSWVRSRSRRRGPSCCDLRHLGSLKTFHEVAVAVGLATVEGSGPREACCCPERGGARTCLLVAGAL